MFGGKSIYEVNFTGCTMAVLYTLPGSYDKTMRCMKEIMLETYLVYADISFDIIHLDFQ